jgi:hypothetical protein
MIKLGNSENRDRMGSTSIMLFEAKFESSSRASKVMSIYKS